MESQEMREPHPSTLTRNPGHGAHGIRDKWRPGRQAQEPTAPDDTLRITTVTDRTRASSRDRYHDTQEKLILRTDTVYVERQQSAASTVAVATTSAEITPDGTIRPRGVILKWIFFILVALVALIIAARIFVFKR